MARHKAEFCDVNPANIKVLSNKRIILLYAFKYIYIVTLYKKLK